MVAQDRVGRWCYQLGKLDGSTTWMRVRCCQEVQINGKLQSAWTL